MMEYFCEYFINNIIHGHSYILFAGHGAKIFTYTFSFNLQANTAIYHYYLHLLDEEIEACSLSQLTKVTK